MGTGLERQRKECILFGHLMESRRSTRANAATICEINAAEMCNAVIEGEEGGL